MAHLSGKLTKKLVDNLSHSHFKVTKTHYGATSDEDRFEVLNRICERDNFSDDETQMIIQLLGNEMRNDDPNYDRTHRLVKVRRDSKRPRN